MQTGENKEFDFLVKSMMENAQEEVPSRVWDSVSSRLDAAASPKPRVVVWRWVGAVASAAAAIALGVFFAGRNSSAPSTVSPVVADVQQTAGDNTLPENNQQQEFAVIENDARTTAIAQNISSGSSKSGVSGQKVQAVEEVVPEDTQDIATAVEDNVPEEVMTETVPAEDTRTALADEPVSPKHEIPVDNTDESVYLDPFRRMQMEDEQAASGRGISLSVGGNVQTNGSPSPTDGFNPWSAPGTAPTESSVQEVSKESNYSIPYSVGLGLRIGLSPKWAIGTGLNYSRLQRTFNGIYTEVENGIITRKVNADIHNTLHYVGIPVNLYYNILDNGRLGIYTYVGGTVEKALRNNYRIPASPSDAHYHQSVDGVQFSAAAGIGLQFRLVGGLNLYFDPSLRYYFDCGQPTSIRTQMPLLMNLEAGLRFDIK